MSHKAIQINGPISHVAINSCELCNWRGEIVWSGVECPDFQINDSYLHSSNGSIVSVGPCTISDSTIEQGLDGCENYVRTAGLGSQLLRTTIRGCRYGYTHLGLPGTSFECRDSSLEYCHAGILFSEAAHNITVAGTQFRDNANCSIGSILGLYPADPKGFADFNFTGNTSVRSGQLFVNQGDVIPNFTTSNNTINGVLTNPGPNSMSVLFSGITTQDIPAGSTIQAIAAPPPPPPPAPVAAFVGAPLSGVSPLSVPFSDQSTGSPTSWLWSFGDGATSTQQNPLHVYAAAGTYNVTLTVTNAQGSNALSKAAYVTVSAPPPPPPTGTIPDVVLWAELDQISDGSVSVERMSSLPTGPATNPGVIQLLDPNKCKSGPGFGGRIAVYYDGSGAFGTGGYLCTQTTDSAGQILSDVFVGGYGSLALAARVKWDVLPPQIATIFARDPTPGMYQLILENNTHFLVLNSWGQDGILTPLKLTSTPIKAGRWYKVLAGYAASTGHLYVGLVDDTTGVLSSIQLPVNRRKIGTFPIGLNLGGHGGSVTMNGWMQEVQVCKTDPTDDLLRELDNNGQPLAFSPSLLAPPRDSGPAPFTCTLADPMFISTTDFPTANGLYWLQCHSLRAWNPALADAHGDMLWTCSGDHPITRGAAAGIYIGYSSSPAIKPTAWTLAISGTGTATSPSDSIVRTFSAIEACGVCYDAANARVRFYPHLETISAPPPGLATWQETACWSTADLVPLTFTFHGVTIAAFAENPLPTDHTGFATVIAPGDLPGVTNWQAYHLAYDGLGISRCNVSADGLLFDAHTNEEELDVSGPFPAGWDQVQWHDNLFPWKGKVYGLGRCFGPGWRGMCLSEITTDSAGCWRVPTGKIWPVGEPDADIWPNTGYTQDARKSDIDANGVLHVYRLMGFFPQSTSTPRQFVKRYVITMV
jgi:PKD repeat protein